MEEKKYKLLEDETIEVDGHTLYRIEALRDFGCVRKGYKGGFVESEKNLSHEDNCWVYDDACVYGNSMVYGNSRVYGNSKVYEDARVYEDAEVCGDAKVYGCAEVSDNARVFDNARIFGNAIVYDSTKVHGNAEVYGDAEVYGYAEVHGIAEVYGDAEVCGDAMVLDQDGYIVFKNWWSSGRYFTWTRSNNMWKVGCFYGTDDELIKKAYADSERSGREYERIVKYVEEILRDGQE